MKVNIILVDECGDEVIAETISETQVQALGNCLDDFVTLRINRLWEEYPEARNLYRETVKSYGEEMAEQAQAIYEEELAWALANPDELDGYDPYEYAQEAVNDYFAYGEGAGW